MLPLNPPPPPPLLCSCSCASVLRIVQNNARRRRAQWKPSNVKKDPSSPPSRGHKDAASARPGGQRASPLAAETSQSTKGAAGGRHSPWWGHLRVSTCYKGNSTPWILRLSLLAGGQKRCAPSGGRRSRSALAWTQRRGAPGRVDASSFSPGYRSKTTRGGLRLRTAVIPKWS